MADALKDVLVNSRGGLYTNEDTLTLANTLPGSAIRMLNMEVSTLFPYTTLFRSAVTSGSPTITVTHSSHGLSTGDRVTFASSDAVGGITPNSVEMVITVVNANSYTVVFTSNASSSTTGGGSSVTFTANNGTHTA